MGYFNHGHVQWKSPEGTGGWDQTCLNLVQNSLLFSTHTRTNQGKERVRHSFE